MSMTSERDQFLGLYVTPGVKEALKIEADKRMTSMSKLGHDILRKAMRDLGYDTRSGKKLPRGQREPE